LREAATAGHLEGRERCGRNFARPGCARVNAAKIDLLSSGASADFLTTADIALIMLRKFFFICLIILLPRRQSLRGLRAGDSLMRR
jgi:hypothetical protein